MRPPRNVPSDKTKLDPWIAGLLDKDADFVVARIRERLSSNASPELACLSARVEEFVPFQIGFSDDAGYVRCIRRTAIGQPYVDAGDVLYIAQPLPDDVLASRAEFFDPAVRPLLKDFLPKYAGSGDEMEGEAAGQFALWNDTTASMIAYYEPEKLGDWKDAKTLYAAMNGDSVFVNQQGGTAWHVFEVNEIVPLFDTFPEFVEHYAAFRGTSEPFYSWESRKFLGNDPHK